MSEQQKILIVDDRKENLVALEKTLSKTSGQIVKALSGNEALSVSLNHDFALAILDIRMPDMDGYELAELLRTDDKTRHLPIIFLTATSVQEADVFKGYESGGVDYILKPYSPAILLSKVDVFLELDRQKRELFEKQRLLEASIKELEAFTYSVSHDLRAPLRHVDGFINLLKESATDSLDEKSQRYLSMISDAATRMGRLIDDLLEFSRAGRVEMIPRPVDLRQLVDKTIANLEPDTEGRDIAWKICSLPKVYADQPLMQIVLDNLISNAVKFTGKCKKAQIEIGEAPNGQDEFIIFVHDNGSGFDMKYVDKLFGVFQRLHRQEEFEGTGIGLANVHRIIDRHGGRTWAESTLGEGASFYFSLPIINASINEEDR